MKNPACAVVMGSIEYAAGQLQVPLVVVMGHEGCGVVEAVGEGVSHVKPGDRTLWSNDQNLVPREGDVRLARAERGDHAHAGHDPPDGAGRRWDVAPFVGTQFVAWIRARLRRIEPEASLRVVRPT